VVSASVRREQVRYAMARGISSRRACRLMDVARSTLNYQSRMPARDAPLEPRLREVAQLHPRYGYRRAWAVLRRGMLINQRARATIVAEAWLEFTETQTAPPGAFNEPSISISDHC
jgi:hypothetical protein